MRHGRTIPACKHTNIARTKPVGIIASGLLFLYNFIRKEAIPLDNDELLMLLDDDLFTNEEEDDV